ncbi:MAG: glutathione S-transferase family protein [Sphingomonadales bacterium]
MIKIWGRRNSFNVQKVMWFVGELGLEHEHIPAGGPYGRLDEPEFRALNPNRMVPVLEDGDLAVWESHSILRYLAARFGAADYWSADPAARSHVDRWLDWAATMLQPAFLGGLFWRYYRTPEAKRQWPVIRSSMQRCAQLFGLLDRELAARPYLAGDSFSLADIPAGASLYRYYEMGLETPALPNVEAWYARLQERPAYREHVMIPFDDLQGRLAF